MEYKMKCNVCGKVFCYTDEDLKKNVTNAGMGALTALGGLASALGGGTILHTHHLQGQADRYNDKVVDYSQCPYCHSRSISIFTGNTEGDTTAVKTISINTSAPIESLLKRVFLFLEDGDWTSADAYCEACLDKNPELAEAYLGKLMAELHVSTLEQLKNCSKPIDSNSNFLKALRYADDELKKTLIQVQELIEKHSREQAIAAAKREKKEAEAKAAMEREEAKRIAIENQKKAEKRKKNIRIASIAAIILVIIAAGVLVWLNSPQYMVIKAINYIEQGDFGGASILLEEADHELTAKDIRSADKSAIYQYAEYFSERSFSRAIPVYELIPEYADSTSIANEMRAMLDKYVGVYKCISNKIIRENGDIEVKELENDISIDTLRYNHEGEICMASYNAFDSDGFFHPFYKQKENESILEYYYEDKSIKNSISTFRYEFSPDGQTLTKTCQFIEDGDKCDTYETVWQKIS